MDPVNSEKQILEQQEKITVELRKLESFKRSEVFKACCTLGMKPRAANTATERYMRYNRQRGYIVYDGHTVGWRFVK